MRILALAWLVACDDTLFPTPTGGGSVTGEGFCAVKNLLDADCTVCHAGASAAGGLDLATDPWTALVGQPSPEYVARTLVVVGAPDDSFLVVKLEGTQTSSEGGQMPPGVQLDAATIDLVRQWIADGAVADCDDTGGPSPGYHPEGWSAPTAHGHGAKYQTEDCLTCHGADLLGGTAGVACDGCHLPTTEPQAWRTECTFCHGGGETSTGAPPEDISDQTDPSSISFPPHTEHVAGADHAALDCVLCHDKPADVLSVGHFLVADATKGEAEVVFSNSYAGVASWDGATTCTNLYCHGDGQGDNGTAQVGQTYSCSACHPSMSSSEDAWDGMSGEHKKHLEESGIGCHDCHASTVDQTEEIRTPSNHVDGRVEVQLGSGMVYDAAGHCTGSCHDEGHDVNTW
jgi:predicted CxxxxCH...CXXCH cytochrome family protein